MRLNEDPAYRRVERIARSAPARSPRTIAIVGGGFSGAILATNLLRRARSQPTRIVLIERSGEVGRGVAYAATSHRFLLNVPAERMSAASDAPLGFLEFARRRIPDARPEDFLPRALYGEYVQQLLLEAWSNAPTNVAFEIWRGEVVDVRRIEGRSSLLVVLADGRQLASNDVVLATGNPAPAALPEAAEVLDHPAYIADPYRADLSLADERSVLLIGASQTAADIVGAASTRSGATPELHLLSRHGLIPARQRPHRSGELQDAADVLLSAAAASLRDLTRCVRSLALQAERSGGCWCEAVTLVRGLAPAIWMRLGERDRRRFLRHARAYWDVHRHRLPPQAADRIASLRDQRRLQVHAGRIRRMRPVGACIEVTWRPRGGEELRCARFDRVINCTGPDYAISRSREPLWRNLVRSGLCMPDRLGLGLRTGPNGAVLDADGRPSAHLFYVGPMLRADHWEATAVSELRVHAERLAESLQRTAEQADGTRCDYR